MRSIILSKVVLGLVFGLSLAFSSVSFAENQTPDPLKPTNLFEIDFAVPWGLRYGQSVRVYFEFDVDESGKPVNINILKSKPHHYYNKVATTSLNKYRYPAGAVREKLLEEMHFCVLSDHISTFACKIEFKRLGVSDAHVAKSPDESGFYSVDKFQGVPVVKKYIIPEYPMQAARKNTCGWVIAEFNLSKGGRARNIKITKTSHANLFSLSVRDALTGFRFDEGTKGEKVEYQISFSIPGKCDGTGPAS